MWKTVKLEDICQIGDGNHSSNYPKSSEMVEQGVPFLRAGNIQSGTVSDKDLKFITPKKHLILKKGHLKKGDVLITNRGEIGKTAIVPKIFDGANLNSQVAWLRPDERLLSAFLYYVLNTPSARALFKSRQTGTALQQLTIRQIKQLEIPLPPLAEQERIVAKLDAAFAKIDEAVEAVKKNIQNSKHYYSYAIDNEFSKYSDKTKSIGEHSKINYGHTAKASFEKGRYKFLRITDIQDNAVDWNSVPYCEVETKKLPSVLLNDGDIVFARTGATTGKSFLVENPVDSVFASYLIRVSTDKKVFLPKYVMHYFQSAAYWQQVNEGISGAAQGGFNATKLGKLRIPVINKTEQLEVIQKLDLINEQSASLQNTYALKMHALNSLKSAILAKELQSSEAA